MEWTGVALQGLSEENHSVVSPHQNFSAVSSRCGPRTSPHRGWIACSASRRCLGGLYLDSRIESVFESIEVILQSLVLLCKIPVPSKSYPIPPAWIQASGQRSDELREI
jgi:hypothetical protein